MYTNFKIQVLNQNDMMCMQNTAQYTVGRKNKKHIVGGSGDQKRSVQGLFSGDFDDKLHRIYTMLIIYRYNSY
jgi:hypothetical protein